jgi:hypothetical protein
MTRQQRFEKMVAQYFTAAQSGDKFRFAVTRANLAHYVAQNAHLVTIQSGNGVQEAMRSGARR